MFILSGLVELKSQQVFSISELNGSDFPKVRASFVALNNAGQSYKNLSKNDFVVFDNGINVSPSITVECLDTIVDPAVSVILILDKSTSMNYLDENNQTRWSWVKEGATSFINTMNLNNGSQIGIISFAKLAGRTCPFTNNKKELLDSLDEINIGGGTEYDPPFLDTKFGAVTMFQNGSPDTKIRRIAIFLTDGEPNHDPSIDSIKKELTRANIQVYSITVAMPMNKDLAEISAYTGGGAYAVYTKDELNAIYEYIALDIQKKQICTLYWDSPFGCTDVSRYRPVSITFVPQNAQIDKQYEAPPKSIAYVELSDTFLEFGNPPANNSIDRNLTLTARNSDFNLTSGLIQPSTYFQVVNWDVVGGSGITPPFTIKKDSSITISVRFTQGSSVLYRQASMMLEGSPCPPTIQLIGGITQIRIIHPNGGEIFSTCETVKITWAGIESDKPVNLSYSSNNGASWNSIANNVTGLSYNWKPPAPGNQYKVRGTVAPVSYYLWAKGIGSPENDGGTSIAVTNDNLFVYVTGGYEGTIDFGPKKLTSRGAKDIFLAKFDSDGNLIWAETAGGPGYDSSNAVCVDEAGNAYITGVCYQNAKFGNITPNIIVPALPNCFIARYAPGGGTPAVQLIGANTTYNTFQAYGTRIRFREAEKELDVRGTYLNAVQSPNGYSLPKVSVPTPFTATLKNDLTFGPVNRGGTVYPDYSSNSDVDADGNRYSTGYFNNNITFGSFNLTSSGKSDLFVNKFGGTPGSEDLSDSAFIVESPKFNLTIKNVMFENTMLGIANDTLLVNQLCNIGTLPILITNTSFSGSNPTDFRLTTNPVSRILQPGECIPLEIAFQPTNIGLRGAQLVISGECTQDIYMDLSGDGVCGGEAISEIDYGKVNLSFKSDSVVTCLFKNTNPNTVTVKPSLTGPHASDFTISQSSYFVEPDSCLTLQVSFIPSAPGPRNAVVEFQLPQGCVNPITELKGEGVETALTMNSIKWGDRRVLTSNDSFIVIKNSSTLPAKIDSLKISNQSVFTLTSPPAIPLSISANDSLVIEVNFTPQTEQNYSSELHVFAQSNINPLIAALEGNGVIPKLIATWICDTATIPGSSSIAQLLIENPSETMDLTLHSVDFKYVDNDFEWATGTAPANVIVPKLGQVYFDVIFTPQGAGTRANLIEISHDAATGPEINPVRDTTVDALCDGLGLQAPDSLDFGGVLICDDHTLKLRLRNTSWQSPIIVTSATISGTDASAFSIALSGEIEIPPSNSEFIDVTFAPEEVRPYSALLTLKTSVGYDINIHLLGVGEYLYFTASESMYENEPGYPVKIPVNLRVNKLSKGSIDEAKMEITYDDKMLRYDRVNFSNLTNWSWDAPELPSPGKLIISGKGTLDVPFDNHVFEIQWTVFLADTKVSQIMLKPIMGNCLTKDTAITEITYSPFCFMDGRLVVTGNSTYYLSTPEPNPAGDKTTIKFGLGLKGNTEIAIYSVMGEHIESFINTELESGQYELDLSATKLLPGTYILRMNSGHIVKSVKLIVNR